MSARTTRVQSVSLHGGSWDSLFGILLVLMLLLFYAGGRTLQHLPRPENVPGTILAVLHIKGSAIVDQPPPVVKKVEPPKPLAIPPDRTPVDLTDKPVLAQKETVKATPFAGSAEKVKPVYGLRRVYATGLGAGGSMADAVVGKFGNTVSKDFDTVSATKSDIVGTVVSTVTVTAAPKFRKIVKPVYTKEMLDNKIAGTVKVKVLIDIDGRVKKAIPLNDIGFGATKAAVNACFAMEFDPAKREADAVAVWIIVPVTFVLLN